MSALEARKKLLVMEAELQRQQLLRDFAALKEDFNGAVSDTRQQLVRASMVASSAALVMGGLRMFRKSNNNHDKPPPPRFSKLSRVISVARTAGTIWMSLKSWLR